MHLATAQERVWRGIYEKLLEESKIRPLERGASVVRGDRGEEAQDLEGSVCI